MIYRPAPHNSYHNDAHFRYFLGRSLGKMDVVTMKLIERETGLPLDLVVFINNFLHEKLTDENFNEAITLWFADEEECKFRFGHICYWNTSRITNMRGAFFFRYEFNEDLSRWNVANVLDMNSMFQAASRFNGDLSQWNVKNVRNLGSMFQAAIQFNGDLSVGLVHQGRGVCQSCLW
jgi:hypothetical protein